MWLTGRLVPDHKTIADLSPGSDRQRVDVLDHAPDALLRWPVSQARLARSR
jgi:hypothetical protein